MEYGSESGKFDGGCVVYMNQYPLDAGNPYRELQMEMYHAPYRQPYHDQDYWVPCYGWRGVLPPVTCPFGHSYSWSTSTEET